MRHHNIIAHTQRTLTNRLTIAAALRCLSATSLVPMAGIGGASLFACSSVDEPSPEDLMSVNEASDQLGSLAQGLG